MKIIFLLGSPDISGGTYVIFEHAIRMFKYGYDISIITDDKFDKSRLNWHSEAKELTWLDYRDIKGIEFDIAIATWWKTVFRLHEVQAKSYIYFVQSIESKFYPDYEVPLKRLVESTYSLPLHVITEATWIKEYLQNEYGSNVFLAHNGIRKDLYNLDLKPIAKKEDGKLRVLVEGPLSVSFKNVEKTIELCNQSLADEIWLLTSSDISHYKGVEKIFSRVPITEVGAIYSSCDVIVKLSYVEGMFGPPLEMFHCGGTTIVYNVTGHDEYIKHGKNGIVVNTDNEQEVITYLDALKKDIVFLNELKEGAKQTATEWIDWEESSTQFRKNIEIISKNIIHTDNNKIKKLTDFHMKNYIEFEDFIKKNYKFALIKTLHNAKEKIKIKYPRLFSFLKKII